MSPAEIRDFVLDNGLLDPAFASTLPLTVSCAASPATCRRLCELFHEAGTAFVACDGRIVPNELEALAGYVGMLWNRYLMVAAEPSSAAAITDVLQGQDILHGEGVHIEGNGVVKGLCYALLYFAALAAPCGSGLRSFVKRLVNQYLFIPNFPLSTQTMDIAL